MNIAPHVLAEARQAVPTSAHIETPTPKRPHPLGNQASLRRLQRKLTVGASNDPLEHEADRVAEQVMRMPDSELRRGDASPTALRRKCASCEEDDKKVQRKANGVAGASAPASVEQTLQSSGQPLDSGVRDFFEPRFGADFSSVRVHTDASAAESAHDVNAQAYAVGSNLVFASGSYSPETNSGRALIAHELAHVVQQGSASPTALHRRVAGASCTAGTNGAPADPRTALDTMDAIAVTICTQVSANLAAEATTVRGGIPATPSPTLTSFRDRFGFPPAQGGGFLNRLTGAVRPSQEIALSEELATISQRFAGSLRMLNQGINYNCHGPGAVNLIGCGPPINCAGNDAVSCPGNSLIALCEHFWTGNDDTARAQIVVHETMHMQFGFVGDNDALRGSGRNFNIAGCYEALAADITGGEATFDCPAPP
jgi:hypothetical protein